jgi:hypothetical protein
MDLAFDKSIRDGFLGCIYVCGEQCVDGLNAVSRNKELDTIDDASPDKPSVELSEQRIVQAGFDFINQEDSTFGAGDRQRNRDGAPHPVPK